MASTSAARDRLERAARDDRAAFGLVVGEVEGGSARRARSGPSSSPSVGCRSVGQSSSTKARSSRWARSRIRPVGTGAPQAVHAAPSGSGPDDRADPSAASLAGARPVAAHGVAGDTPGGYHGPGRDRAGTTVHEDPTTDEPDQAGSRPHRPTRATSATATRRTRPSSSAACRGWRARSAGIARMIEREEYCVDILQQTAALRAAVDALSILVLEDHVAGCVRTAAERGEADAYVDEVIDVVRRTLGRPVRGSGPLGLTAVAGLSTNPARIGRRFVDNPVDGRPSRPLPSGIRTGADARVTRSARGSGRPGREPDGPRKTEPPPTVRDDADAGSGAARTGWHANHRRRVVDRPREPLPTRVEDTPTLPPAYDAALDAGPGRPRPDLPPDARAAIDGHARLLLAWTAAINLTAIRDPAAVATAHVVDSLTAVAVLRDARRRPLHRPRLGRRLSRASRWRPPSRPRGRSCSSRSPRRPASCRSVIAATGLDATGRGRAGPGRGARRRSAPPRPLAGGRPPAPSRRSPSWSSWPSRCSRPGGRLVAWKRGDLADELAAARPGDRRARRRHARGPRRARRRPRRPPPGRRRPRAASVPAAYPRDPAARRRRPW